jgi:hypothetical protein
LKELFNLHHASESACNAIEQIFKILKQLFESSLGLPPEYDMSIQALVLHLQHSTSSSGNMGPPSHPKSMGEVGIGPVMLGEMVQAA